MGADRKRVAQQRDVLARRVYIHAVALDAHLVFNLAHDHVGPRAQQLGHQAFMIRRQVLDQHEGHARMIRHSFEQPDERLQPTRRRADSHDGHGQAVLGGAAVF